MESNQSGNEAKQQQETKERKRYKKNTEKFSKSNEYSYFDQPANRWQHTAHSKLSKYGFYNERHTEKPKK